jgi:hypothetical protein
VSKEKPTQETAFPESVTSYSPEEAAQIIGVKPNTLARWRCTGRMPLRFFKAGSRVRYRLSDIEKFQDTRASGSIKPPMRKQRAGRRAA